MCGGGDRAAATLKLLQCQRRQLSDDSASVYCMCDSPTWWFGHASQLGGIEHTHPPTPSTLIMHAYGWDAPPISCATFFIAENIFAPPQI